MTKKALEARMADKEKETQKLVDEYNELEAKRRESEKVMNELMTKINMSQAQFTLLKELADEE